MSSGHVPNAKPALRAHKKQLTAQRIHKAALDMALDRGAVAVTIDEICERALISPRTFFNYYASKTAAMLGIPSLVVTDAQRERFLASENPLLDDLCELLGEIAEVVNTAPDERRRLKALLGGDPELAYEMFSAMSALRKELRELAIRRAGTRDASIAAALVFAAMPIAYMGSDPDRGPDRLRATIAEMCEVGRMPTARGGSGPRD